MDKAIIKTVINSKKKFSLFIQLFYTLSTLSCSLVNFKEINFTLNHKNEQNLKREK